MFGLCVRFTCKDETSARAYDRLVAETVEAIRTSEPGTLLYASHLVNGQPLAWPGWGRRLFSPSIYTED
jgi:hypothetical protein